MRIDKNFTGVAYAHKGVFYEKPVTASGIFARIVEGHLLDDFSDSHTALLANHPVDVILALEREINTCVVSEYDGLAYYKEGLFYAQSPLLSTSFHKTSVTVTLEKGRLKQAYTFIPPGTEGTVEYPKGTAVDVIQLIKLKD